LQSIEDVGLRPVGEHFANYRRLVAVLLPEFGEVTLVVEGTGRVIDSLVVAIGAAATSTSKSSSSTAT
jgi:hypothetical protein